MLAPLPVDVPDLEEAEVGFLNEIRGLIEMAGAFAPQAVHGDAFEVGADEPGKLVVRIRVAALDAS